jgi:hypothetical protein
LEVFFIYLKLKLIVSPGIARGLFVDDKNKRFLIDSKNPSEKSCICLEVRLIAGKLKGRPEISAPV